MSLYRVLIFCLVISLSNTSCVTKSKDQSHLDKLEVGDRLRLWANYNNRDSSIEEILIVKQENTFKACYSSNNSYDSTAGAKNERIMDTSKILSKKDEETVDKYIRAIQLKQKEQQKINRNTVQGFVLFTKRAVEIGTDTHAEWKAFDTVKRNIFNLR